ncbi:hypothetical protein AB8U03_15155 [Clostridium sp. Mt-5]|uniref:Sporulation protein Cse60 n=1 Tax=Clostridium moutaii TaxID=3240932 RepID=A0ABV4BXE4_9CLOT
MITYRSGAIKIKGLCGKTLKSLEDKIKDALEVDLKDKMIIDIKYAQTQNEYTALIIYDKGIN